ncbi:type II secretion system protein [Bacillus sp. FJAT-22090]|uniref:type II secretion system protein n=1 Tax=Bacillus sp. FJAT-22090 TaxID=1581038 RepID=UPI0021B2A6F6|nr:type II secretion system protein [Bacillus sp. FJAT-22090]
MKEETNEVNEMTNKGANQMKKMRKLLKNEKGMTLIELLAVIVILAIVAAIAVPAIGNLIENSRVGAIKADAQNAMAGAQLYFQDNPDKPTVKVSVLVTDGFLEDKGSLVDSTEITKGTKTSSGVEKMTIDGSGQTGGVKIAFAKATNENINNTKNSERGTKNNLTISTGETETETTE